MRGVILAAGRGTRLAPWTDTRPKCLVEVGGKPLLEYQIEALAAAGIRECVLVVGYRASQVRAHIGRWFGGVDIVYVESADYERTNNLYSLWLARHLLDDDTLLLEGDLVFDQGLIADVARHLAPDVAVVDPYTPEMDGTVVAAEGDVAEAFVLKADQGEGFDYRGSLKTVNIYKLCRMCMSRHIVPMLDAFVAAGQEDTFYEAALARLVSEGSLRLAVHHAGVRRWTEIDTEEDLHRAREMFQPSLLGARDVGGDRVRQTPS